MGLGHLLKRLCISEFQRIPFYYIILGKQNLKHKLIGDFVFKIIHTNYLLS